MHMDVAWQSLYVRATKNCCALLAFTENFSPLVRLQDFDKRIFCYSTLWMTHCIAWPGQSPRSCPLYTSRETTLFEFYRCAKSMHTIALCMHCEHWTTVPLWRNYKMLGKSESSQPWHSESVVTQQWVKPHACGYCWRQKLRLETSLRLMIARFANLGDLDEISQRHSTFCKL